MWSLSFGGLWVAMLHDLTESKPRYTVRSGLFFKRRLTSAGYLGPVKLFVVQTGLFSVAVCGVVCRLPLERAQVFGRRIPAL